MSSFSDTATGGGAWRRRGACGALSWAPLEVLAVVLGFAISWPIGLALLIWGFARRRGAARFADCFSAARDRFTAATAADMAPSSGNAAFDEWRKLEIERLEEEHRKLDAARRAFADFVAEARKAKDREEFERFMAGRGV